MKLYTSPFKFFLLAGIASSIFSITASSYSPAKVKKRISAEDVLDIATQAYIYGYPLVMMEMTRRVMTNVVRPEGTHAPMNQFAHLRSYPTASFKDITAPNADTLYSVAWLDLSRDPWVLSLPDEHDHYYLMPMLSAWTNVFAVPGKRTTGTKEQSYVITGPRWNGTLPKGLRQIKAPTNLVWILGRTYCSGTMGDYRVVHSLQDKYKLIPLSSYGRSYAPPQGKVDLKIDMKKPVRTQVNEMDAQSFFTILAQAMKINPPARADRPLVKKMAKIGIVAGKSFSTDKLNGNAAQAIKRAPSEGLKKIMQQKKKSGKLVNGWIVPTKTGRYGTDYLQRAFIAAVGLGANLPHDAVYPTASIDSAGNALTGQHSYVIHFPKGQNPPAKEFWSLTMYNSEYFLVDNPLNKYTVSSRDDLKYNKDGSLTLYIQHESPGKDKEPNWLPAPQGEFNLMLRLYWNAKHAPSILDGSWLPPAILRIG